MPLVTQDVHVPFTRGVDLKTHEQVSELPSLTVAENVVFDQPGALGKKPGSVLLNNAIAGGGTLSNIRGLATRDDELVCFADDKIYSWSPALQNWQPRGDYINAEVTAKVVVQKPTEQTFGDRARWTDGTKIVDVYAWYDSANSQVHCQVFDGVSGAALSDDTSLGTSTNRPNCLRVGNKLHVYCHDIVNSNMAAKVIDPKNVNGTIGSALVAIGPGALGSGDRYSVCLRWNTARTEALAAYMMIVDAVGSRYHVYRVDEDAASVASVVVSRIGTLPSICYEPNLDRIATFRMNGATLLKGDILNGSTLADTASVDVTVKAATANTTLTTAEFRQVAEADGTYRAVVWVGVDVVTGAFTLESLYGFYFGTDGATAAISGPSGASTWGIHCSIGARAFSRSDGKVYLPVAVDIFDDPLVSTYLLCREDGLVVSRLNAWVAGDAPTTQCLPQVEYLGSDRFAFSANYRTRIGLRDQDLFSDRGLRDFILDFTSPKPYKGVQVGRSLYMAGSFLAVYDGVGAVEANFHNIPSTLDGSMAGAGGNLSAGSYNYLVILEWRLATGEIERSTYIDVDTETAVANDAGTIAVPTIPFTAKRGSRSHIVLALYRQQVNAGADAPYYRVTSLNPTAGTGNNGYFINDPTTYAVNIGDILSDATLITKEPLYLNSGELDNLEPDPGNVLAAGQSRLVQVMATDDLVLFSKRWSPDNGVAFNDALTLVIPRDGGKVVATHPTDNGILVFKENRIYLASGAGPDNLGQGAYSEPQLLPVDTGCKDARTIIQTAAGVFFQSPRGFYLLTPSLTAQYIGAPVEDYNGQEFVAALLDAKANRVVFVAKAGKTLVYDFLMGQWATWTAPVGLAAVTWRDSIVFAPTTYQVAQVSPGTWTDVNTPATQSVETPWIKMAGLAGYQRTRRIAVLGKSKAAHTLRVRVAYDFDPTWVDDRLIPVSSNEDPYLHRFKPKYQKSIAFKVRVDVTGDGEGVELSALAFSTGIKPGLSRVSASRSH